MLGHLLGGGVATRHFHFQRVVQQFFRQPFDLIGEGGGEEQVLAASRQFCQHAANIVDEAHVEHTVGFVEHQDFNAVELHGVLMFQIEQTARGGYQHVHAAAQFHHLWVNAHATKHHQRTDIEIAAVLTHVLTHLGGEFTGRGQDQGAHRATAFGVRLFLDQTLQQRQGKARGFTGAGLGAGHQIAACQHGRNGLLLNRGRFAVALLFYSAQDFRVQAKGIKRHNNSEPPRPFQV